jgi:hypothetical protein
MWRDGELPRITAEAYLREVDDVLADPPGQDVPDTSGNSSGSREHGGTQDVPSGTPDIADEAATVDTNTPARRPTNQPDTHYVRYTRELTNQPDT